jgi:TonB family protein
MSRCTRSAPFYRGSSSRPLAIPRRLTRPPCNPKSTPRSSALKRAHGAKSTGRRATACQLRGLTPRSRRRPTTAGSVSPACGTRAFSQPGLTPPASVVGFSSNVRHHMRNLLLTTRPAYTAIALVLLSIATGGAVGQSTGPRSELLCGRAMANGGARVLMPSLTSPSIRDSVCACIGASLKGIPSEPSTALSIEVLATDCIRRAAPAESIGTLPPSVVAQLDDAFAHESAPQSYFAPKADFRSCKLPEYPPRSLRAEAVGTSRVAFRISADGKVLDAEIVGTAGVSPAHKLLDVSAMFSLMQCPFEPAKLRGKTVEAWTEVSYVWKLK